MAGVKNPNYGKKISEESRKKQSLSRKKLFASGYVHPMKGKKFPSGRFSPMKGQKHSEKTRRKIRKARAKQVFTKEAIEKRRLAQTGKKRSAESRRKMSEARMGIKLSKETRRRMSESKKGTKQSEETIRKRGESRARTVAREDYVSPLKGKYAGKKNPYYGKTHSEEIRRKMKGRKLSEETKQLLREARIRQKPPKKPTWPERFVAKMLETERIPFEKQKGFRNPYCVFDFYIEPKICIFTDGDYYHCNPKDYIYKKKLYPGFKPNDRYVGKKYAKDKWASDKKITRELRKKGYTVIRIWQSELETDKEKCLQKILKAIK